jgi:hypothetical protein
MITSSCHCGAVKLEIDGELPETLTSCNCSICKRYGNLMAYYPPEAIKVIAAPGALAAYSWGDKTIAFQRCATCGCMSHWVSLDPNQTEFIGVNARLFDNVDISGLRIRHFDGAETWKFLE